MRRTIGNLFFYGGIIVVILAWVFHNRPPMMISGYSIRCWLVGAILGVVFVLLGVVISGPTRKR